MSITEIVSDCQQIGTRTLLIDFDNYIFCLPVFLRNQCFFLFDSHSKDENGRMSATGTAVLLKIRFIPVIEKLYKISILLKLPNDALLPSAIFQTKMY